MCRISDRVAAAFWIAWFSVFPLDVLALQPPQIVAMNKGSVVTVETESAQGSGVVTARETVLTNCHVVAGSRSMKVRISGKTFKASLVEGNVAFDLCKLLVPGMTARPVAVRDIGSVRLGERVVAIGSPLGFESSVSDGLVSGLRDIGDSLMIQTSAAISPGSSGGGLFDEQGKLLGITTSSLRRTDAQNINFATPATLQTRMVSLTFIERFDETRLLTAALVDKLMDLYERHNFAELDSAAKPWLLAESSSAYALTMAGFARTLVDKPADAKVLFQKALQGNQDFAPALWGLATVDIMFNSSANLDQTLLDRCAAADTTKNSIVAVFRAQCLSAKKDPAGLAILDAFIADQPTRSWLHLFRGQALAMLGRFDEALKEASVAQILKPESTEALCSATSAFLSLRRFSEAAEAATTALNMSPDSPLALRVGIFAAISVRDVQLAKERFGRLTRVAPLFAEALRGRLPLSISLR